MNTEVILLGDLTLDLLYDAKANIFRPQAGGSVLNTASVLSMNGMKSTLCCRVSEDLAGRIIKRHLEENCIDLFVYNNDSNIPTSIALATVDSSGKPTYNFYKDKTAIVDYILPDFSKYKLLHIASSFAYQDRSYSMVDLFIKEARKQEIIITYDINLRSVPTHIERSRIEQNIKQTTVLKGSDEDFLYLIGSSDKNTIRRYILGFHNVELAIVTFGGDGAYIFDKNAECFVPTKTAICGVSTIGAGDAFMAGVIEKISGSNNISSLKLLEVGGYGNFSAIRYLQNRGVKPNVR